jgi:hypothetical protein
VTDDNIAGARVVAVLLADGWHQIVPGSFLLGPVGFGPGADAGVPGFRFEETAHGSPYQPTVLAGPLASIVAVRQVTSAARRIGVPDRARAAYNGHRTEQEARLPVRAGR